MTDPEDLLAFCEFGEDRVYLLVAIARAKENPDASHGDLPVIREIVEDRAELTEKMVQLDHAVARFDERFRLYLTVNARDALSATFRLRGRMDDWLEARLHGGRGVVTKFKQVDSEYASVLQSDACKDETYFIFDLDDATAEDCDRLREAVAEHTDVAFATETPNGYHVVTEPFNYNELSVDVDYELKTDGLVFVSYIGDGELTAAAEAAREGEA
ncbi:hypothetical protein [Halomicrobium urmianum]|uniref:hypothetical protein n=1 Tax=Halomicrobium urmianum TaxID=1586233 RepID=UPI001CDA102F|nr:hypothetical protein [Halomicrobium urmianum]